MRRTRLHFPGWLLLLVGLAFAAAAASGGDLDYSQLDLLVVQNDGIEKSLRTYAEEQVRLVTDRRALDGARGTAAWFALIRDPARYVHEPFFKVSDRGLRRFLGTRRVSLHDILRAQAAPGFSALLHDSESARRSWNALVERADALGSAEDSLTIVPQVDFRGRRTSWIAPRALMEKGERATEAERRMAKAWIGLKAAARASDARAFAAAADELISAQNACDGFEFVSPRRIRWDLANTRVRPFYWSAWFYPLSAVLFLACRVKRWSGLSRIATAALALAFLLHVGGLVVRGVVLGRVPVASLYESMVFAVAGSTLLALVFLVLYRAVYLGIGGAVLGALFMGVANSLPISMTRANPLIAALQSYWLKIHVTTIMISYSAFALSFFLCVVYLVQYARQGGTPLAVGPGETVDGTTPRSDLDRIESLNLKVVCFGLPMLTIGIVTGAVWANTAWGRPWGWDPKETWAAITWLIYVAYLHTRLMVGWRGLRSIVVSLIGFAAVLFTYLGVSYLLPGLHSYI